VLALADLLAYPLTKGRGRAGWATRRPRAHLLGSVRRPSGGHGEFPPRPIQRSLRLGAQPQCPSLDDDGAEALGKATGQARRSRPQQCRCNRARQDVSPAMWEIAAAICRTKPAAQSTCPRLLALLMRSSAVTRWLTSSHILSIARRRCRAPARRLTSPNTGSASLTIARILCTLALDMALARCWAAELGWSAWPTIGVRSPRCRPRPRAAWSAALPSSSATNSTPPVTVRDGLRNAK
jgi:hypothetical protein